MKVDTTVLVELEARLIDATNNPQVRTQIHNELARYLDPYVPMDSGTLSASALGNVTPEGVRYETPYAHYMYTGIVYGPNIPIIKNGVLVGFFSRPNKTPTGADLQYSTEKHPLATHHWDKAMMRDKGDEFTAQVKHIITEYLDGQK